MRRLMVLIVVATLFVLMPGARAQADGNEAPGAPEAFRSLTAGGGHTCAIRYDGAVQCWGDGRYGALGLGSNDGQGDSAGDLAVLPTVDLGTGRTATAITAGYLHTCALLDDGHVKCWGDNDAGQLGIGTTSTHGVAPGQMGDALPAVDLGTGRTATAITTGVDNVCALLDDGHVKCWGENSAGQLGLGDTADRGDGPDEMGDALPAVDLGTGRTATAITAGQSHACALLDDGRVKCWGRNAEGQLGLGDTAPHGVAPGQMGDALPTVDLGTGRTAIAIAASNYATCALLDDGHVKCWGYNAAGQLGLGDTADRGDGPGEMGDALPAVDLGAGRTATAISGGTVHACALLDTGEVKCWGANTFASLGVGDDEARGDGPGEMGDALPAVDLGAGSVTAITSGSWHNCALLGDDRLKCWGDNQWGKLGIGDTDSRGDEPGEMGDALPVVGLRPGNDDFAAAQALTGASGSVRGSNANAHKQPGEPNHDLFLNADSSVWYQWTAPGSGRVALDTIGSTFDTVLAVYTGTAVDALTPVASNDDAVGLQSQVTFTATAGITYRIAVAGFRSGSGRISLNWLQGPVNDDFAIATVLTGANGNRAGSNEGAGTEPGEPNHNPAAPATASIWYQWTAPAGGRTSFTTAGSTFDTVLAVYTGSTVDGLTLVGNNDDAEVSTLQSRVVFTAAAGTTYRIAIAGYQGSSGGDHGATTLAWNQAAACDGRSVTVALAFGDHPTAGNDVIRGTSAGQRINGGNGGDRICGGGGADTLIGGNGNDRLLGEAGADTLQGGAGADRLVGGTQRDACNGGPQRDTQTGCEVRQSIP